MDQGALIFLVVVFFVAFVVASIVVNRFYPVIEGEPWTRRGMRNVFRHGVAWGLVVAAGLIIVFWPS